jgi:hypothetical protein
MNHGDNICTAIVGAVERDNFDEPSVAFLTVLGILTTSNWNRPARPRLDPYIPILPCLSVQSVLLLVLIKIPGPSAWNDLQLITAEN